MGQGIDRQSVLNEFNGLELGDKRLVRRGRIMAMELSKDPSLSFPRAMKSSAALEGAYRFVNNPKVEGTEIAKCHIDSTWERSRGEPFVLSFEDTTEMRFGGNKKRAGLGELMNGGQGFFFHPCLIASVQEGVVTPLGLGSYELLVRDPKRTTPKSSKTRAKSDERESLRWITASRKAREHARKAGVRVIHVCDREADDYAWIDSVLSDNGSFIARRCKDRRVGKRTRNSETQQYLNKVAKEAPLIATRTASFEERTTSQGRRRRDPRSKRTTALNVYATTTTLLRPDHTSTKTKELKVNLVEVREVDPPKGEEPINWSLLTSEPIDSPDDVQRIVDAYRSRWLVEEYFKAIKTGCSYEQAQLESLHALHNALSLCLPMAWQLLLLRSIARDRPELDVETIIDPDCLWALRFIASKPDNDWGLKISEPFTAGVALRAIARLGGHLKRNGPPGWLTLARGYATLQDFIRTAKMVGAKM